MTNIIKIKRSATTATPASLEEGELAYSENSGNLFIGTNGGSNIEKIGGNTDVQTLSNHIADATIHFTVASIDHTAILNIGTNTHAQLDTHLADATIHFTQAAISITASQVSDFDSAADARIGLASIGDLVDVDLTGSPALVSGNLLQYNGADWVAIDASTVGVLDHVDLLNIGVNTHAQIDTHIADGSIHFTVASIDHGSIAGLGDDDHTQYALVDGTRAFTGAVTINGDLTVTGTTTTLDTENLTVTDNTITLNNGETGAGVTLGSAGIEIDRGTENNVSWVWNEATDQWGELGPGSPELFVSALMSNDIIDGGTF